MCHCPFMFGCLYIPVSYSYTMYVCMYVGGGGVGVIRRGQRPGGAHQRGDSQEHSEVQAGGGGHREGGNRTIQYLLHSPFISLFIVVRRWASVPSARSCPSQATPWRPTWPRHRHRHRLTSRHLHLLHLHHLHHHRRQCWMWSRASSWSQRWTTPSPRYSA